MGIAGGCMSPRTRHRELGRASSWHASRPDADTAQSRRNRLSHEHKSRWNEHGLAGSQNAAGPEGQENGRMDRWMGEWWCAKNAGRQERKDTEEVGPIPWASWVCASSSVPGLRTCSARVSMGGPQRGCSLYYLSQHEAVVSRDHEKPRLGLLDPAAVLTPIPSLLPHVVPRPRHAEAPVCSLTTRSACMILPALPTTEKKVLSHLQARPVRAACHGRDKGTARGPYG